MTGLDSLEKYWFVVLAYAGSRSQGTYTVEAVTLPAGAQPQNFEVSLSQPPPEPQVGVTAATAAAITEGEDAVFTIVSDLAQTADLRVTVTVSAAGDYGAGTGRRAVIIPAGQTTLTLTIPTTDDQVGEDDGSVTVTVDDDSGYVVDPAVIAKVKALAAQTSNGPDHVNRWNRVLVAFGEHDGTGVTGGPMTLQEATQNADRYSSPVWDEVVTELTNLANAGPQTPELSISGGAGITEGGTATFTITASPAPASPIMVNVGVSESGDFGSAGAATVTVSGAATTYTVTTTDDQTDEPDGSVTATLQTGTGYTVSSSAGAASVSVADNDAAPASYTFDPAVVNKVKALAGQTHHGYTHVNRWNRVLVAFGEHDGVGVTGGPITLDQATQNSKRYSSPVWGEVVTELTAYAAWQKEQDGKNAKLVSQTPVVSISGGSGVTEGGTASFTITASPAPTSPITVNVGVSQNGSFGASGSSVVTVSGATTTYTITTSDDNVDESDGSVTATLKTGSGYTVSTSSGSATVNVADNDDPRPEVELIVSVEDASAAEGEHLEFTVRLGQASTEEVKIKVEHRHRMGLCGRPGPRRLGLRVGVQRRARLRSGRHRDDRHGQALSRRQGRRGRRALRDPGVPARQLVAGRRHRHHDHHRR